MFPGTAARVPEHTSDAINRRIHTEMEARIRWYAERPEKIGARLQQLDQEWDVERTLEANAAALAFSGVVLAGAVDRRWLALPALVTAFLFQHATQGWCPPLPVLRRLGFRTMREIDTERTALKALRGDFDRRQDGDGDGRVDRIMQSAQA
jgi:hypothetical protein